MPIGQVSCRAAALLLGVVVPGVSGCTSGSKSETEAATEEVAATDTADAGVFTDRVVVFLMADSARMEAIRRDHGEDDFYVVADDMMWYRAEAWSWFEERGIPVVSREGRPELRFRVGGRTRTYDFSAESGADVIILYDRERAPVAVAPIDAATLAEDYYAP